jgi:hypothetical protein
MGGGDEYKDSRVEQDIKAEVVTCVDDHLDCEEPLLSPATTTLQQVADEVARHGLPHDTHHNVQQECARRRAHLRTIMTHEFKLKR